MLDLEVGIESPRAELTADAAPLEAAPGGFGEDDLQAVDPDMACFEGVRDAFGARRRRRVMMPAARPKSLSLAMAMASASVVKVRTQSTGPKISSARACWSSGTSIYGGLDEVAASKTGRALAAGQQRELLGTCHFYIAEHSAQLGHAGERTPSPRLRRRRRQLQRFRRLLQPGQQISARFPSERAGGTWPSTSARQL